MTPYRCRLHPFTSRRLACGYVTQRCPAVVDHPVGQHIEREPVDRTALLGLTVDRIFFPGVNNEEEGHAPSRGGVVHDVTEVHILRCDSHADLLLRFPDQCLGHRFTRLKVSGGQVPGSVLETGVLSLPEENLAVSAEYEVYVSGHHVSLWLCPVTQVDSRQSSVPGGVGAPRLLRSALKAGLGMVRPRAETGRNPRAQTLGVGRYSRWRLVGSAVRGAPEPRLFTIDPLQCQQPVDHLRACQMPVDFRAHDLVTSF